MHINSHEFVVSVGCLGTFAFHLPNFSEDNNRLFQIETWFRKQN